MAANKVTHTLRGTNPSVNVDDALTAHIDAQIEQWEKSGKSFDACSKAMTLAIDRAREPVTIEEWIEVAKKDTAGRRKYSDDLFEPEAVKTVVLDLVKKKRVIRLGRQTFCSQVIVGEMADAIDNVMVFECAICTIDELAELLAEYKGTTRNYPLSQKGFTPSPKTNIKIKKFIEEQIVTKAMDTMESLTILGGGEFTHNTTLETCRDYAENTLAGRWQSAKTPMSKNEFFEFVYRSNFTGMDNQYAGRSIKKIKECLEHPAVREFVLQSLVESENIVITAEGKVTQYKKMDKYLWLKD